MVSERMKREIARNAADFQVSQFGGVPGERKRLWRSIYDAVVASLHVAEGLRAEEGLPQPSNN